MFLSLILLYLKISDGYELGGLGTNVMKRDAMESGLACRGKSGGYKEPHCLYPGDLYPFTRRPMFIIIDSDNSFVFQHIPKYFVFFLFKKTTFLITYQFFQIFWSTLDNTYVTTGCTTIFSRFVNF